MITRQLFVIAILGFGLLPSIRADGTLFLTVQTAVAMALTNNAELKIFEARIETARRSVGVAKTYSYNPEIAYDEGLDRHIGISQTIEWPGKRALRQAIAKQDATAAQAALDGFKVTLAAEVRARFYALLTAHRDVELRQREHGLAVRVLETASNRVERAFAAVTERTSAEAGVVLAKRTVRVAQSRVIQAQADLNLLLGLDANAATEIHGELTAPSRDVSLSNLTFAALTTHPDLQAARLELGKRGLNVRLARKEGAPDITVQPFFEQDTKGSDNKVGISLSVPLPIWKTSRPKVAVAQAEVREAEADLEKRWREITANISKAFTTWNAAREDLSAFSPELQKRMETELTAAEQRYAGGELTFLSLVELRRTYFDYMDQYYQSLAAVREAQSTLEKTAAIPLEDLK